MPGGGADWCKRVGGVIMRALDKVLYLGLKAMISSRSRTHRTIKPCTGGRGREGEGERGRSRPGLYLVAAFGLLAAGAGGGILRNAT